MLRARVREESASGTVRKESGEGKSEGIVAAGECALLYTSRLPPRVSVLRVITVERKLNHCRLAAREITNRSRKDPKPRMR